MVFKGPIILSFSTRFDKDTFVTVVRSSMKDFLCNFDCLWQSGNRGACFPLDGSKCGPV